MSSLRIHNTIIVFGIVVVVVLVVVLVACVPSHMCAVRVYLVFGRNSSRGTGNLRLLSPQKSPFFRSFSLFFTILIILFRHFWKRDFFPLIFHFLSVCTFSQLVRFLEIFRNFLKNLWNLFIILLFINEVTDLFKWIFRKRGKRKSEATLTLCL